jgi:hypothetical protein
MSDNVAIMLLADKCGCSTSKGNPSVRRLITDGFEIVTF